jgi:hypothetical protein
MPSFNNPGEKRGLYCGEHKLLNMINVIMKRCKYNGCNVYPTFNFSNLKTPLYCNSHKLSDMVNVVDPKCITVGCITRPLFNYPNETKGLYCLKHKLLDMIDIVSKCCLFDACKIRPVYNIPGESIGIYCCKHKLTGMINVKDRKCRELDCNLLPSFNIPGVRKGIYCAKHQTPNMVNVIEKHCKTPLCNVQVKDKYEGYCLRCFMHLFPEKPVARNYKTKEQCVYEYLIKEFSAIKIIHDKRINGGEYSRRPDILIELPSHCIIIEIDENQHKTYDCSCENKRLMQLSSDLKFKSIIFIRFNPDKYYDSSSNMVASCWYVDKNGICRVKNMLEWNNRLLSLNFQIDYWIKNIPGKMLEIVQLYYDQN